MILVGDDIDEIAQLKLKLQHQFEMKDLGPLRYFLSIEVALSPKAISFLSPIMQQMSSRELVSLTLELLRLLWNSMFSILLQMGFHWRIQLFTAPLLAVWFISPLLNPMLPMLLTLLVNLSPLPLLSIGLLFYTSYVIFRALYIRVIESIAFFYINFGTLRLLQC